MQNAVICPACKGNGYRYVQENEKKVPIDCKACDNQGEIPEKSLFALRYLDNYK